MTMSVRSGPPILVVAGPTASGKSALAADAAAQFGGVVINADSMQVYEDLPILTAHPGPSLRARAPHRLYGVLDGAARCSAGRWRTMALAEIDAARRQGALPILAGGTGLYLRALLRGLAPVPEIPEAVRRRAAALQAQEGTERFHARLAACDPGAARRIPPGDAQRALRAYEVLEATGRPLAAWQAEHHEGFQDPAAVLVLEPERAALYEACNARFDAMLAQGAMEEVGRLLRRDLDPGLPVMKAVGVRPLADHLAGRIALERAAALARQETRRYAKRQTTWLRHQLAEAARLPFAYRADTQRESLERAERLLLTVHR